MILGAEIVATLLGLYMIIMGKGWGKRSLPHWQYRVLGVFLLLLIPVVFIGAVVLTAVTMFQNPGLSQPQVQDKVRVPLAVVEIGGVLLWVLVGTIWEKAIRKKAQAQREAWSQRAAMAQQPIEDAEYEDEGGDGNEEFYEDEAEQQA